MFRDMRRKRQQLSDEECRAVLKCGTSGVLAVCGDGGYPYAVPLSYAYNNAKIYFHCASEGHKLDGIRSSDKVSFCVIDRDEVVPEEYTTRFKSVIVFGRARVLEGDEKRRAISLIAERYNPGDSEEGKNRIIDEELNNLCTVELSIEYMTGKCAMALVK